MKKKDLYIREDYLKTIRGFVDSFEIIKVITGVRRCGKSSLMEMIADELLSKKGVQKENIAYIHLDRRPYKGIKKPAKLEKAIDKAFEKAIGPKYLFVDEIQNVKGFEEVINAYREEGDYSIFITGSNAYLLSGRLSTKLTGRYIEFEMSTLSFSEYLGMKRHFNKPIETNLDVEFSHYVREGGFPLAVSFDTYQDKQTYVNGVIAEIFEKDIRKNKRIKNRPLFDLIETYIINNFGSTTSIGRLVDYLNHVSKSHVRKETVYNYLSILENAKIVSKCRRFDLKSKKSLLGEEKYYLSDLSFYFARNTDNRIIYGPVLENVVYQYAKSLGYSISIGRIGLLEVDFILRKDSSTYAYVQVANTILAGEKNGKGIPLTEEREYVPLESIGDNYPKFVLTLDRLLQKRSGIKNENIIDFMTEKRFFN